MKNGVSVIIPCYNTEKYLSKCLDMILKQDGINLEIILIDDCSNDGTLEIIKDYASKYNNIKFLENKSNMGAGYSRNRALKEATYEYISFIDSDDYIENDFYKEMIGTLKKGKADVVVCDIFVRYDDQSNIDVRSEACSNSKDRFSFINNGLAASPCNKIFKKELLLKYPFAEGIMNEDIPTVIAVLINANKVVYTKDTYYNYIQRKHSVQNSFLSDKKLDIFKALDLLEKRVARNNKNKKYWNAIIYNQIIMFLIYVIPKEEDFFKRQKFIKKFVKLSKKYSIRKNNLWWNFLESQGKKHNFYYRALLKTMCNNFVFTSNLIIEFYKKYNSYFKKSVIKDDIDMKEIVYYAKKQSKMKHSKFKISVVIPNYNYEKFLLQRLYSILYQKVQIAEIIILDDCSKDNSRKLIDEIEQTISKLIPITKVYNEKNSGSAFKQWEKGFSLATGDYVWIAEADDYCEQNFLKKVTKPLKKNNDIVISYADTAFINQDGLIIMKTIKPEIDILKTGHWDSNFVNDSKDEISKYAYLNCTIANVSSIIIKNDDYNEYFKKSREFKQAGDWLFYLNVMKNGKIAFYNKPLNYYRLHGNNVTSTTKKQLYFDEIVKIHDYISAEYSLTTEQKKSIKARQRFLKKVWGLNEK